jgi:hypothetical protein
VPMTLNFKAKLKGDLALERFNFVTVKFNYFIANQTNHVIMVG